MRVCDRCRCPDPSHIDMFMWNRSHDLCENCYKDYKEITEVFESMEQTFIKGKTLKHIDFQWEDAR